MCDSYNKRIFIIYFNCEKTDFKLKEGLIDKNSISLEDSIHGW